MDSREAYALFESQYESCASGSTYVMLEGEFGIGKKHIVDKLIAEKSISNDNIIKIDAALTSKSPYAAINQAVCRLISKRHIDEQQGRNFAKKASMLIPKFGEMAAYLIEGNRYNEALYDVIRRSGINTESYNVLSIANFLEELTSDKRVILYCNDIQWYDEESWEILLRLIPVIVNRGWFCVFSYTVNADQPSINRNSIDQLLSRLSHIQDVKHKFKHISIGRWGKGDLSDLCESILHSSVKFTAAQIDALFQFTEGLPLYVRIVLDALDEHRDILSDKNGWRSNNNWDSERIRIILKDIIKNRINSVYSNIPQCRDLLEVGSAIRDDFTDEVITGIFHNAPTDILREVESRYRVIQYIIDERTWKFEHVLIQDYIYRSLGNKANDIHHLIAKHLELNPSRFSHIKIAHHYYLAKEYAKFAEHYLAEIKKLMEDGCYKSAMRLIDNLSEQHEFAIFISGRLNDFLILKGRAKFHNISYIEAIEILASLLNSNDCDENNAECAKWLAKTYLKLDSQDDFNRSLVYLKVAEDYYRKKKDYSSLGDILLDFIVAYAHMNNKEEAEKLYRQAEICFNAAKDMIGLLRLQRRTIIFMDAKVSAPILYKVANSWGKMNVIHEKIMCLNNAAVQYFYLNEYGKAKEILLEALNESINFDDFGMVYIHNNLGIINSINGDTKMSCRNYDQARKGKYRAVEQLIVDINKSIISLMDKMSEATLSLLEDIYKRALLTGEESYIVPSAINLSIALRQNDKNEQIATILESIEKSMSKYHDYERVIWYDLLYGYYLDISDKIKLDNLVARYGAQISTYKNAHPNAPKYAYTTMEYWSDN
jgi:hypothetical protein